MIPLQWVGLPAKQRECPFFSFLFFMSLVSILTNPAGMLGCCYICKPANDEVCKRDDTVGRLIPPVALHGTKDRIVMMG